MTDNPIFTPEQREYKNMVAVASMLAAVSPNNSIYEVRTIYYDFGDGIGRWTTIVQDENYQILNPKEWEIVKKAETTKDLYLAVENIRNSRYFKDL